jgi:gamma-glutamyl-gamma-aminobutyrate hydrolase PuuD
MRPRVAVTFNPASGGAALSLRYAVSELDVHPVDADYRKIVPPMGNIETIFQDERQLQQVFQAAKVRASSFLDDIDGLILSGNPAMVDPRLYGKSVNGEKTDLERSIAEMALTHVALQRGIPIMAICGGHQVLNVYLGGVLTDLSEDDLRKQGILDYERIAVDAHSELEKIINPQIRPKENEKIILETFFGVHYQVVEEIGGKKMISATNGDYLKVVARSQDSKANIEAVESQFGVPVYGLQFHPEVALKGLVHLRLSNEYNSDLFMSRTESDIKKNKNLFAALVKAAKAHRCKKSLNSEITHMKIDTASRDDRMSIDTSVFKVTPDHLFASRKQALQREIESMVKTRVEFLQSKSKRSSDSDAMQRCLNLHGLFRDLPGDGNFAMHVECTAGAENKLK